MTQAYALLIDDDTNNLGILAELLSIEGVHYTKVQNPLHLDSVLNQINKLDVVFLDLELPGMNGYDILKKLKQDPRFASVPVVAYTVHVSEINTARKLGFHSFLGKPIDAELFSGHLHRILNGEHVWALP